MLHPAVPKEPVAPKVTISSYTDVPITFFQPTLPAGLPSSAELIVTMINASLQAIHEANSTLLGIVGFVIRTSILFMKE